ncbi:hypothetical protein EI982_01750 [Haloplanus rallus]|uniref:Uncharacterized protein n=1 Tax=Haloplanus rallus TaxID=1816183 RepID=A0A6B9F5D4_9EURY|nr:hypothetical protein [Haloplanus rallus]QGX93607.1 hypothetical protein EI982_01750 [Haloplanus rallus]
MVQLRSCYFCGGVGDSLREYEVVPERLDTGGDGRSAVLCSTCHEKLRRMLEPLAGESASTAGTADPEPASLQEVTFASDAGETASESTSETASESADREDDERERSTTTSESDPDGDVPEEYYTVLRLLQNREFPMERATLVDIVTGAYDVSEPQCERILETAVERGVLVTDGSTLDLGRS